jgi:DNA-directed RNA polymerase sigma subunit (sigma70/sigma32)
MQHAVAKLARLRLRLSRRFLEWRDRNVLTLKFAVDEKHYTPAQLAKAWGVSVETVRQIFRVEPGVLKIGKTGSRHRRRYITLRIPEEVAERVHQRLSA